MLLIYFTRDSMLECTALKTSSEKNDKKQLGKTAMGLHLQINVTKRKMLYRTNCRLQTTHDRTSEGWKIAKICSPSCN